MVLTPDRSALIFLDNRQQDLPVDLVEAVAVDFQHFERGLRVGRSMLPAPRTCA